VIVAKAVERVEMDRAGYFVIIPNQTRKVIVVEHYAYDNQLQHVVEGSTTRDLYQTIIDAGWVSQLSHAAYLGKELAAAELSLRHGFTYIQDAT
jgi:tetrahydromethanopterin S-methyltransferase subunit A